MKRRGVILLGFLLVLLIPVVSAYHGNVGIGGSYAVNPDIESKKGIDKVEKPLTTPFEKNLGFYNLPDLTVEEIGVPDKLPKNSIIGQGFPITIKNVGETIAEGQIMVLLETYSKHGMRCQINMFAGGGLGAGSNPSVFSLQNLVRSTYVAPGESLKVYAYDYITKGSQFSPRSGCLTKVLNEDITFRVTVNPVGGSLYSGTIPKGRIKESDMTNNVLEKTVEVVDDPSVIPELSIPIKFMPGMNIFSMPVEQEMNAYSLTESTGCTLFGLNDSFSKENGWGSRKVPSITPYLKQLAPEEMLKPGTVYGALCEFPLTVTFAGKDPGFFEKKLTPRGVTAVTTRAGMMGRQLHQLIDGCSNLAGGGSDIYMFTKGWENVNQKSSAHRIFYLANVVPGETYFVYCYNDAGGTWDFDPAKKEGEYEYRKARILDEDHINRYGGRGTYGGSYTSKDYYYFVPR
ncbi:hypothetical protein HZA97_05590 [Candidatus Woesearchaeota archaeon]|nr:hypothetical protein [Candidatus Woesearchaeota archaeon]